jgi:hypothetical protein
MTAIIGIDPGFKGAVAFLTGGSGGTDAYVIPTPLLGSGIYDEAAIFDLVRRYKTLHVHAIIEQAQAFPKQGVSSTFKTGFGYGLWRMALVADEIPYTVVSPARWQRAMFVGVTKADSKKMSIVAAKRLFPGVSLKRTVRSRVDDHNMADALLIAEYGRRQFNGPS